MGVCDLDSLCHLLLHSSCKVLCHLSGTPRYLWMRFHECKKINSLTVIIRPSSTSTQWTRKSSFVTSTYVFLVQKGKQWGGHTCCISENIQQISVCRYWDAIVSSAILILV
jgi:hypothetical protein